VAGEPPNLSQMDEVSAGLRHQLDFHGGILKNKIWHFLMNKNNFLTFRPFSHTNLITILKYYWSIFLYLLGPVEGNEICCGDEPEIQISLAGARVAKRSSAHDRIYKR